MTGDRLRECRHCLHLTVQHLADVRSNKGHAVDARLVRGCEAGLRTVPPKLAAGFWFERPPGP